MKKFRKILVTLLAIISLTLTSCSTSIGVGGLQKYDVPERGYQFLYPNGWIPVDVKNASTGVDVVYHDLIERTENLSVIVNPVAANKTIADLGTPSEIGYRFLKQVNNDPNANLEADLIKAESQEKNGKTYYILEYKANIPDRGERHNLASVSVSRGKLYTFSVASQESRWEKQKDLFDFITQSFSVY
jgi:photosystem II oxygen-evolving enhancer protein 2